MTRASKALRRAAGEKSPAAVGHLGSVLVRMAKLRQEEAEHEARAAGLEVRRLEGMLKNVTAALREALGDEATGGVEEMAWQAAGRIHALEEQVSKLVTGRTFNNEEWGR